MHYLTKGLPKLKKLKLISMLYSYECQYITKGLYMMKTLELIAQTSPNQAYPDEGYYMTKMDA